MYTCIYTHNAWELPPQLSGKETAFNTGDTGDTVSIPGSEKSPEKVRSNSLHLLAGVIPRTEKPGGLQSMGWQRVGHN